MKQVCANCLFENKRSLRFIRSIMMRFGKISLAAVAAASLLIAPVAAQAAPAVKAERVSVQNEDENNLQGGSKIIIAILAAAAVIAGIVIAADNGDDSPTSPG
jgi:hypothetical protein